MRCGAYSHVLDSIFRLLELQPQNGGLFLNSIQFDQFHERKTCPRQHLQIILDSNELPYKLHVPDRTHKSTAKGRATGLARIIHQTLLSTGSRGESETITNNAR